VSQLNQGLTQIAEVDPLPAAVGIAAVAEQGDAQAATVRIGTRMSFEC
jgi:hypothetical protein